MAISKFKITRAPKRSNITIGGIAYVLNQEYPISGQATMVIEVLDRGVPYDDFGFRLGNENAIWSNQYKALINAQVNSNLPDIPYNLIDVKLNETNDLTGLIVPNDSTDRIKIISLIPKTGELYIDGTAVVIGKTYMTYEFINLEWKSSGDITLQNEVGTLTLQAGNKDGLQPSSTIDFESTANLSGTVEGTSSITV